MRRLRTYEGEAIEISYDLGRCIHAEECVHGLPSVFDRDRRPWVDPQGAGADEIAAVIHRCPTGALRYRRRDGGPEEEAPREARIRVGPDGPLYAHGPFRVRVPGEEEPVPETRVAFCRCGLSKIKPYCDDSHYDGGFEASGPLGTTGKLAEDGSEGAPVEVTPAGNGPLLFRGDVEISDGGSESLRCASPALCRCGHSSNKPFCDGTHKVVGFQAEGF